MARSRSPYIETSAETGGARSVADFAVTPGHPGFERFLRVWFGLGRDGELRKNGIPRRFHDLALLADWDPSILVGPLRLLSPVMNWSARRARARGRDVELLSRYGA